MTAYLNPSQEAGRAFFLRGIVGEIVMLNLLRLRDVADYSDHPELAPPEPISGARAYDRYLRHSLPFVTASGGEILFYGEGDLFLIGPPGERWDRALIVRQRSTETFMAFAQNDAYLAGLGHRTAAIEDSRLLPLAPLQIHDR